MRTGEHAAAHVDIPDLLATARADAASGAWDEVREHLRAYEDLCIAHPELAVLCAEAEMRLGEPGAAIGVLLDAMPILEREAGVMLRRALNLLGAAYFMQGIVRAAQRAYERALELSYAGGDLLLVARITNNLGILANVRGEHESALAHYRLALPAFEALDNAVGAAECHHNMAISHRDTGRLELAAAEEKRALALAREAGCARVEQQASVGLAELALLCGDAHSADVRATRAAVSCANESDRYGETNALRLVAEARARRGESAEALQVLERSISLARRHENRLMLAEALRVRAQLFDVLGLAERAGEDAEAAVALFEELGATEACATLAPIARRRALLTAS